MGTASEPRHFVPVVLAIGADGCPRWARDSFGYSAAAGSDGGLYVADESEGQLYLLSGSGRVTHRVSYASGPNVPLLTGLESKDGVALLSGTSFGEGTLLGEPLADQTSFYVKLTPTLPQ